MTAATLQLIILPAGTDRRAVRHLPRPRRPGARHRAPRRCRTSPGRSSRARSPSSGASTRRSRSSRSSARSSSASSSRSSRRPRSPTSRRWPASPIGIMTGIAFLVGAACSMASGIIGMFVAVQAERPDRVGRPAQPRRGGPGRDARRGRLGLPRRRPVAARRLGHLHRLPDVLRRSDRRPGAVPHRRLRLRRVVRRAVRPARRRHLHEGRRRRRRTSSARSRRASPRTTRATRASSRTSSATTSATAPAAAPTCSSRPPPRTSAR